MTKIYDLSDPAQPRFIRDFGLPGQEPGSTGTAPEGVHGPIALQEPRLLRLRHRRQAACCRSWTARSCSRATRRRARSSRPPSRTCSIPQIGRLDMSPAWGGHTSFPVLGVRVPHWAPGMPGRTRDFVLLVSESLRNECQEFRQLSFMVDVTTERDAVLGGHLPGARSHRRLLPPRRPLRPALEPRVVHAVFYGRLVFLAYFNAGVRAVDIRDPFHPVEAAYFIPAVTAADRPALRGGGRRRRAARSRSRPTTSRWTTGATSTSRTAPTPGCTSWS